MSFRDHGWDRPTLKGAEAIWGRLHRTGREDRRFGELDEDTLDDLCIQARDAVDAYLAAKPLTS